MPGARYGYPRNACGTRVRTGDARVPGGAAPCGAWRTADRWATRCVLGALLVLIGCGAALGAGIGERAAEAFEKGEYGEARALFETMVKRDPGDPVARYNLACALAQLGKDDESVEMLVEAVRRGFTRFADMERDESLAPVRGHETYRTIVENVPRILQARGDAEYEMLSEKTSSAYVTARDEALRLNFASASDDESFGFAQEEISRVARWTEETLFALPADTERDPWVAVILPTPIDFYKLVRGASGVGGYYDRDNRRLVSQDVGPTLRHEFFHVLHWRHMERLGQVHPHWVAEGLASLLEDVEVSADGRFEVVPSWRTNAAARLARTTRFPPIEHLASLSTERFLEVRPASNYAIGRSFFMFLMERGALRAWYQAYTEGFEEDPTGMAAARAVLGMEQAEINRAFRAWLRGVPEVGERIRPGGASLGVEIRAGAGSGPVVSVSVRDWRRGNGTALRSRDIIKGIDGREIRSIDDLYRVLGEYRIGAPVTVLVSRWSEEVEVEVELVAADR